MIWTKHRPIAPGWYWLRLSRQPKAGVPVQVYSGIYDLCWTGDGHEGIVRETEGEWAGPVARPMDPNNADPKRTAYWENRPDLGTGGAYQKPATSGSPD